MVIWFGCSGGLVVSDLHNLKWSTYKHVYSMTLDLFRKIYITYIIRAFALKKLAISKTQVMSTVY